MTKERWNFWRFASEHPVSAFFMVFFICDDLYAIADRIVSIFK